MSIAVVNGIILGMILPLLNFKYFGFELSKILFLSFMVSIGVVMVFFRREMLKRIDTRMIVLWLLFIGGMFILSVGKVDGVRYWWGEPGRWQGLWFFLLMFLLYMETSLSRFKTREVGLSWLLGALGTVIFGVWQKIEMVRGDYVLSYAGRVISSVGQPNFWADYLLIGWVLVWFSDRFGKKMKGLSLIIVLVGLWLSGSRFTVLVFTLLILIWLLRFIRKSFRKMAEGLIIIGTALFLYLSVNMGWWEKRLSIWQRVFEQITEKFWTGHGLGDLYEVIGNVNGLGTDRAHSVLLDMWLIGGVGLVVIFFSIWFRGVWFEFKEKRKEVFLALIVWMMLASVHVLGVLNWVWLVVLLGLCGGDEVKKSGYKKYSTWQVLLGIIYGLVILFGVLRGYSLV